ncbi:hypothetical protein CVT25_005810 [Psilocybe cyanescens]|uniref:Uncharacterized protein n=1 Tax=Psilocybe cyanescens TaxID=93625 RepID=A0A409XA52_PSICY|nr:hypothetical protein CVT25_005810 [Psilocybe cyanescens]
MATPSLVNIEISHISGSLNGTMLLNFLLVLYLLCFLHALVKWYTNSWSVVNGDTRESTFWGIAGKGPQWTAIWRCYHVWGQSFHVIAISLILLAAEFGLSVTQTVLQGLLAVNTGNLRIILLISASKVSSALLFVSLGATWITTFLIGYKIHFSSFSNGPPSKRQFNRIVVLVVESSAAYSILLLFDGLSTVAPPKLVLNSLVIEASYFVDAALSIIVGVAPTVLVARLAIMSPSNAVQSTVVYIQSEFQRGGPSDRGCTIGGDVNGSIHTGDAARTPVIEVKRESSIDVTLGGFQV